MIQDKKQAMKSYIEYLIDKGIGRANLIDNFVADITIPDRQRDNELISEMIRNNVTREEIEKQIDEMVEVKEIVVLDGMLYAVCFEQPQVMELLETLR